MDPNANLELQEMMLEDRRGCWRDLTELRRTLQEWMDAGGFEPEWGKYPLARRWFGR